MRVSPRVAHVFDHTDSPSTGPPTPPLDPTHEIRSLRALRRLGHEQWTCKEQGLAVTLVLENRLDLLVVMPTGHGKLAVFMIPPMVTSRTVVVVDALLSPLLNPIEGPTM